jgi:hypothetical protein
MVTASGVTPAKYFFRGNAKPGLATGSGQGVQGHRQAMALIRVLAEDQPDEPARTYQQAMRRGEQWRRALTHGANRIPRDVRQMLDEALAETVADT